MFAGPNGSGKSTLKTLLAEELLGVYVNPDEIEANIRRGGTISFSEFGIPVEAHLCEEFLRFLRQSDLLKSQGLQAGVESLALANDGIDFSQIEMNSYWASVVADFLRQELIRQRKSFTFETVMSSPDKVRLLERAQRLGYRTYLYFIATDDPSINVSRVQNRVRKGGHTVPVEKIVDRYGRSLGLLLEAIRHTNRALCFR